MSEPTVPPPPSYTPPPPPTGTPPGTPGQNRGLMIALSYLWLLAIVPLVTEKNDAEVQWHAKHGLVLFVAEIVLFIVLGIAHFIPFLGWVFSCVTIVLPLLLLIFHIILILKAENGQRVIIPGLSEFADRF